MGNLWTIFRRELGAYYSSTIGYIFMIVFQVLSVGLTSGRSSSLLIDTDLRTTL